MIHPSFVSPSYQAAREDLWAEFTSRFVKKRKQSVVRWFFLADLFVLVYATCMLLKGDIRNSAGQPLAISLLLLSALLVSIPVLRREFRVFTKIRGFESILRRLIGGISLDAQVRQVAQYIRVERMWYLLHGLCWTVVLPLLKSLFTGGPQGSTHWSSDTILFSLVAVGIGLWYEYREHRIERDRLLFFVSGAQDDMPSDFLVHVDSTEDSSSVE